MVNYTIVHTGPPWCSPFTHGMIIKKNTYFLIAPIGVAQTLSIDHWYPELNPQPALEININ